MSNPRFDVIDARGLIFRRAQRGIIVESPHVYSTILRTITAETIRKHVRDMRQWADHSHVNDTTFDDGTRVVTARRHVSGVENIRTLRIQPRGN